MSYDFSGLSPRQQELLTFDGWQVASTELGFHQPQQRTVRKLLERGLLVEREAVYERIKVREYHVPLDVHMAWCDHCSRQTFPEVP